jgi:hypothetical protein
MSARRSLRKALSFFRRRRSEVDLAKEIRSHLECAEEDALRRGLSREEVQWEARRLFGGIEQIKEKQRDSRGIPWLETFLADLRHGIAGLRRAPVFALTALSILSLGIGGTIAVFSLVDAVMLRPLPFPEPDRIVGIWEASRPGVTNAATVPEFLSWKHLGTRFEAMAAEQLTLAALNASAGPLRLAGKLVTSEYFKVFGVHAALGRTFAPEEDQPGAVPVVVLSHSAWQTYFGADPDILRHTILLDENKYQVIGVLQPGAFDRDEIKFWRPLVFTREDRSSAAHRLIVYGRIRADSNVAQAREQMKAIHSALLANSLIDEDRAGTIEIQPLSFLLTGSDLRPFPRDRVRGRSGRPADYVRKRRESAVCAWSCTQSGVGGSCRGRGRTRTTCGTTAHRIACALPAGRCRRSCGCIRATPVGRAIPGERTAFHRGGGNQLARSPLRGLRGDGRHDGGWYYAGF